jgi:hypothetical protein
VEGLAPLEVSGPPTSLASQAEDLAVPRTWQNNTENAEKYSAHGIGNLPLLAIRSPLTFSVDSGKEIMARCINEHCNLELHSLSEGRLFQFEVISISLAANDEASAPFDEKPQRETVHFWLCGNCASLLTLVLDPARGLKLLPLQERPPAAGGFSSIPRETWNARRC